MSSEIKSTEQSPRKILVVDDDRDSLEIIGEALNWEGYEVKKLSSAVDLAKLVDQWKPDLCVLDVNMPGKDGPTALKELKASDPFMAVIFISGNSSSEAVISGLDSGADDYIPKPFDPLEMLARVRTQLRIKELTTEIREVNLKLKELVDIDDLTGLYNMRSVYQRIDHELERGRRFNRPVCVVMMDMDKFKSVNDGHDHLFGSFVISQVGAIVREQIRNIDLGARYGGDEFLIMLTETHKQGARIFCERLRGVIEETLFKSGKDEIRLTASLGFAVTSHGDQITNSRELVRSADLALYEAKRSGRNCVRSTEILPLDAKKKPPKKPPVKAVKKAAKKVS